MSAKQISASTAEAFINGVIEAFAIPDDDEPDERTTTDLVDTVEGLIDEFLPGVAVVQIERAS